MVVDDRSFEDSQDFSGFKNDSLNTSGLISPNNMDIDSKMIMKGSGEFSTKVNCNKGSTINQATKKKIANSILRNSRITGTNSSKPEVNPSPP
jgi:hypothetical protein